VDRVLSNNEFKEYNSLGVGIGASLDVSKLRYHKIIIMSDADVVVYTSQPWFLPFYTDFLNH
jgi:DNA gyrase/topoisomerase IV subunit B